MLYPVTCRKERLPTTSGAEVFFYLTTKKSIYLFTLGKKHEYLHSLSEEELERELEPVGGW